MYTIKLQVADSIHTHIINILDNLNKKEVKVIEDKKEDDIMTSQESLKAIFKNKSIDMFQDINNPMKWQEDIRSEWS